MLLIIGSKMMEILYGAKNGVHAFRLNSAKSERIWMKFGATSAHCWGLALAHFRRDPLSSDSLRGSRNFVVSPVEYAGGKRSLRAYIAVCPQIHCNPFSFTFALHIIVD